MIMESKEPLPQYVCIHEKQVNQHEVDIAELKTRVEYKHQIIEDMKNSIDKLDAKLDKINDSLGELKLQSERDDFDINNRVTKLETSQATLRRVISVGLTAVGTAVAVLAFILTNLH